MGPKMVEHSGGWGEGKGQQSQLYAIRVSEKYSPNGTIYVFLNKCFTEQSYRTKKTGLCLFSLQLGSESLEQNTSMRI